MHLGQLIQSVGIQFNSVDFEESTKIAFDISLIHFKLTMILWYSDKLILDLLVEESNIFTVNFVSPPWSLWVKLTQGIVYGFPSVSI